MSPLSPTALGVVYPSEQCSGLLCRCMSGEPLSGGVNKVNDSRQWLTHSIDKVKWIVGNLWWRLELQTTCHSYQVTLRKFRSSSWGDRLSILPFQPSTSGASWFVLHIKRIQHNFSSRFKQSAWSAWYGKLRLYLMWITLSTWHEIERKTN